MYINSKILLSLLLASDVLSCVCVSFDRVRILFVYALNMFVYILSIFYVSVNCLYTLENILNVVCVGHRQRATRYTWLGVSIMSFYHVPHTLRCVSRLAWMYSVTYVYTLRLRIYARMWLVWWLVYMRGSGEGLTRAVRVNLLLMCVFIFMLVYFICARVLCHSGVVGDAAATIPDIIHNARNVTNAYAT